MANLIFVGNSNNQILHVSFLQYKIILYFKRKFRIRQNVFRLEREIQTIELVTVRLELNISINNLQFCVDKP